MIKIKGNIDVDINIYDFLTKLKNQLFYGEYYIKENKLYKIIDIGTHNSDLIEQLVDDVEKTELFKSITFMINYYEKSKWLKL